MQVNYMALIMESLDWIVLEPKMRKHANTIIV